MILTACLQLSPSLRSSIVLARIGLAVDLVAVLGTLALYASDPRGNLQVLVPAIQAEAGVVLGLPLGFWFWGLSSAGYAGAEALSENLSGAAVSAIDLSLRIAVGFVLTAGGGILWGELSEQRRRALAARELEVEQLQRLVGKLEEAEERYRVLVEQTPALLYIDMPNEEQTPVYIGPKSNRSSASHGRSTSPTPASGTSWSIRTTLNGRRPATPRRSAGAARIRTNTG